MKDIPEYEKDLASIRTMMERSAKFLSLSGLSGVLAGVYALIGAGVAYSFAKDALLGVRSEYSPEDNDVLLKLILIAALVLIASIATGLYLSNKKAKRQGLTLWSETSRKLAINIAIPLVTGGLFILIMFLTGHFELAAPASLIFYGLALIQGSANTFDEVRYLGYCEIFLGLISAIFSGFGIIFWALGFGVLHIIYGGIMYNKYDK
jgi:predicted lysophospholipase L1 biosynthesis ABC-type transport system permease subunit